MRSTRVAAFACAIVLMVGPHLRAELAGRDTLELRVARADVVVRALVISFDFHTAVLGVTEPLKGQAPRRIKVQIAPGNYSLPNRPDEEGLFLLRRTEGGGFALDSNPFATGVVWFENDHPEAFSMNFQSLRGRDPIIAAARSAATAPKPARIIAIEPPAQTEAYTQLAGGDAAFLRMPVDARLQTLAARWVELGYHEQAVLALREFRSDETARRIEAILHDEQQHAQQTTTGGSGRLMWQHYPVRDLAWQTLNDWNVRVPRPVIWEPQDRYWSVHALLIVVALLIPLTPVIVAAVRSRRGRRTANAFAAALAMLAVVASILWLHTRAQRADELYYDGAERQLWLTSFGGWLQLTMIDDWTPGPEPDRYTPLGDWLDEPSGPVDSPPRMHIPRGLLWGVVPHMLPLWEGRPSRVTREQDWLIAVTIAGTQQDWGRNGQFPIRRWQMSWELLIALLAAYPLLRVMFVTSAALRAQSRRRRGLCADCGYDLRGSADRCPECGARAVAVASR